MLAENKPHIHLTKQVSTLQLQSDQQFKQTEKIVTGNFLSFFPPRSWRTSSTTLAA